MVIATKLLRQVRFFHDDDQIAPKILIYADLMGTANSRCLEAAQRILNKEK